MRVLPAGATSTPCRASALHPITPAAPSSAHPSSLPPLAARRCPGASPQLHPPRKLDRRAGPRPHAAAPAANQDLSFEEEEEAEEEWCAPALVSVDNRKNPHFTVVEVGVTDYPGLMRVIAWVLNGLDVVAQNAVLSTSQDGYANNTFWLSTRLGTKLGDEAADSLVDRLRQFLQHCSPGAGESGRTEFCAGPITISNTDHAQYTSVVVVERLRTPGLLLEVASVLGGLGVEVLQGIIQGCSDCGDDVPSLPGSYAPPQQPPTARTAGPAGAATGPALPGTNPRMFKFWVRNRDGGKLPPGHCRALLYALGKGLGYTSQTFPLRPPNMEEAL